MPAVLPNAPAAASKPTAMPSAAATPVVSHAAEAAAAATKGFLAAQRAPTHVGWIVQIGAFDIERDAQRQLSTAHAKAGLGYEGNVLVHRGTCTPRSDVLETDRDERMDQLGQGLPQ